MSIGSAVLIGLGLLLIAGSALFFTFGLFISSETMENHPMDTNLFESHPKLILYCVIAAAVGLFSVIVGMIKLAKESKKR
jgi:hypothetical protein